MSTDPLTAREQLEPKIQKIRVGHMFGVSDDRFLCLDCARRLVPENVSLAEAFEAKWNEPTNPKRH